MLGGDEDALRGRCLAEILAAVDPAGDGYDLETLAGDTSKPMDWFGSAGTVPFLAERRTVLVRNLLRSDPAEATGVDFSLLPETALLILVAEEEAQGERSKPTARASWEKIVTKAGGVALNFAPDAAKTRDVIRAEASANGSPLTASAAECLVEMTGGALSRALGELEKVMLYVGDQGQIRESDVRAVVVPSREWNVFKMVDAVVAGNVTDALSQLRSLVSSPQRAEEAAYRQILPQVARQLRLIWQARLCFEAGCRPSAPTPQVLRMLPEKPNIVKEQPYRQTRLMQSARRTSLRQLSKCFAALSDTDARLKGALGAYSAIDTLERMLLDMAHTLAEPVASR